MHQLLTAETVVPRNVRRGVRLVNYFRCSSNIPMFEKEVFTFLSFSLSFGSEFI